MFEGCAWWMALCEFKKVKGKKSYLEATQISKDPALFTVLFEDTAAMLGIVVAFYWYMARANYRLDLDRWCYLYPNRHHTCCSCLYSCL